jgi:succinoglycan biosynthesis transport protein ExoP
MDQQLQTVSNYQQLAPLEGEAGQHIPPTRLFGILLRRKWLILALIICVSVPATLVIYSIAPFYDASALMMLDTRQSSFRDLQATISTPDADLVAIATQVGIIRSPALAAKVVDKLNLTQEPEFSRLIDAPPTWRQKVTTQALQWIGVPEAPTEHLSSAARRQVTANMLTDKISILNDSKSYIITIRARTGDPKLSADIANAYVSIFIDFKKEQKIGSIQRANTLLDDQIAPLAARVSKADQAVETYRAKNGLLLSHSPGDGQGESRGGTVADQQLAQINAQLITVSGDLAQKQANLRQIDAALRSGHLDAIPEVVSSALINSLRAQQSDLSSRAASLSQSQMSNNPTLRSARAAEAEVQQRINAEISKIAVSVRNQVNAAQAQVDGLQTALNRLQGQVGTQSQANVQLRQLESEARAARSIYQDYLNRFQQTLSQSSLQQADADEVSAAEPPLSKSGPPRALYLVLVILVSSVLASLIVLLIDRLRSGVTTMEQLEAQTGLFGLGFVPTAPSNLRRILLARRPSIYNESVSVICNLLQFGQERYRARVVLVTSAVPNEGKSLLAVSLAATVGREGRKALLIDCDMRRPSVAKLLGIKANAEQSETAALLRQEVMPGLDVVTFRPVKAGSREVVQPNQIQNLLDEARLRYDMIILDTPPVLPFADTPILSLKADGAIMVVRWRHTPATVVASAVKMLNAYGVRVLGGVVTQVKMKEVASGDSSHAHMYRHYSSYFR